MRIDSHQHFWSYNETDYVWMGPGMDSLKGDFTPDDLAPLLTATGMAGSVAVQARQMVEETEYLLSLAESNNWILGVVGWLDFGSKSLAADLERFSANDKLKGLRELIHDMPNVEYCLTEEHKRAIKTLGAYSLTYDLLLRPEHIEPATRLVDMFPQQAFVIDHIAKPDIAGGELEPWQSDIAEIAKRENVYCKLSGMVTETATDAWSAEQFEPYLDVCFENFGARRLMIGSDWPVCTLAGDYEKVMNVVMNYASSLSASEQTQVLGDTCARFYGILPQTGGSL